VQADNDVAQDQLLIGPASTADTTDGQMTLESKTVGQVAQNLEPNHRPSPLAGSLARERYLSNLRATIERHRGYPLAARRRHLEGTAILRFSVMRNGQLSGVQLARSSGEGLLDTAALNAVRAVEIFPAAPLDVEGEQFTLELPVVFHLTQRTATL
jgi:protein TonB